MNPRHSASFLFLAFTLFVFSPISFAANDQNQASSGIPSSVSAGSRASSSGGSTSWQNALNVEKRIQRMTRAGQTPEIPSVEAYTQKASAEVPVVYDSEHVKNPLSLPSETPGEKAMDVVNQSNYLLNTAQLGIPQEEEEEKEEDSEDQTPAAKTVTSAKPAAAKKK